MRRYCALALFFLLAATAALVAQGQGVVCDGTGLTIQQGLQGVSGATIQSLVTIVNNGPNLVLNPDFTYDADGNAQLNTGALPNLLTPDSTFANIGSYKAIKNWAASGGGTGTYGGWGWLAGSHPEVV